MEKTGNQSFDWIQIVTLAAASPLFVFPKPRFWWIFFIIPGLWTARKVIKSQFIERTVVDLPIFIFLTAVFVTTLRVRDFNHSLPKIAGVLFAIAIFYAIVALLKTEKLLKWAVILFLVGGILFSLAGLMGMPTFKTKHLDFLMKIKDKIPQIDFKLPGVELGFATNVVGGILLLVIPLFFVKTVITLRQKKEGSHKKFHMLLLFTGLFVTGGVLLLTQSRGAWAGLFISSVIIGLLLLLRIMKRKKIFTIVLIALLVVGTITCVVVYSSGHADQLIPGIKQAEGTMLFRIQLWDLTVPFIRDNLLYGIGLNNFRIIPEVRYFLSHAHNQFLHVAVELGIPALMAFLAILLTMGYMCVQTWKKSKNTWIRTAVLGLGWGQLAHLFFCLTDAIPPGAKVGIFFWISLALIIAIYKYNARNDSN